MLPVGVPFPNPLVRKLETFADLGDEDRAVIARLTANPRQYRAGHDLIREGDRPEHVFLLLERWAYRYKILASGARQIIALLLPGDFCDIHIFVLKHMDHGMALLNDAKVVAVPAQDMLDLMDENRDIERALWWATLVDEAILREWLTSMGQRDAFSRIAHLLVELWLRMRAIGLADDDKFSLPLTQTDLGDALGLTPVHVNRTLQRLRAEGLITFERKQLTIHGPERLMALSGFEPNYLHLGTNGKEVPRWRIRRRELESDGESWSQRVRSPTRPIRGSVRASRAFSRQLSKTHFAGLLTDTVGRRRPVRCWTNGNGLAKLCKSVR